MTKSSAANVPGRPARGIRPTAGGFVVHADTLVVQTDERIELIDMHRPDWRVVGGSGVREGIVSLWSMHTTFTVFMNESQPALHADIKRFLEQMVDRDADWKHNDPEHSDCDRLNADAHLRAMLLGHSLTLQVSGGEVVLGQWQRVLVAELDGPRARTLRVQIMGIRARWCSGESEVAVAYSRVLPLRSCVMHASAGLCGHRRQARRRRAADLRRRRAAVRVRRICWRSAGSPIASARSATARAPTTTTTSGSKRRTSASRAACSARSRG